MDNDENPQQYTPTPPAIPPSKSPILYSSIAFLVLLLAISLTFTQSRHFPFLTSRFLSPLKPSLSIRPNPPTQTLTLTRNPTAPYCVLWMAPFLSGGGYSSEAWSYIAAIHRHIKNPNFKLAIDHHGDLQSLEFWEGLPDSMKTLAMGLYQTQCKLNETIVVCHSEPGAWNPPLFQTPPCPPSSRYGDFLAVVGRTMFETDRVNSEHVKRCNRMDFVWVPTEFHVSTFIESGVEPEKVVKVVQPVDVEFFDPNRYDDHLDIFSVSKLIMGKPELNSKSSKDGFVFMSIFKWEYRKGWDVLLNAYLKEFSMADNVALYLLTNPYHTDGDFDNKITRFVEGSDDLEMPVDGWARVYVIDTHINQVDLPRLYKAADAFVLPSRGEGWGRPIVEAMAMSLPVIATNWSGPTEFLNEQNGYPLAVDRMSEVLEGPFKGHLWAEPSVDQLRVLMGHVKSNPEEAKGRGRRAREDMISRFSPEIVAEIVRNRIHDVLRYKNTAASR